MTGGQLFIPLDCMLNPRQVIAGGGLVLATAAGLVVQWMARVDDRWGALSGLAVQVAFAVGAALMWLDRGSRGTAVRLALSASRSAPPPWSTMSSGFVFWPSKRLAAVCAITVGRAALGRQDQTVHPGPTCGPTPPAAARSPDPRLAGRSQPRSQYRSPATSGRRRGLDPR